MIKPIIDSSALEQLCARLRKEPWIAVDTEFVRERTYYAHLALIQIATPDLAACIDPQAVAIDPLLEVLYTPTITKVLHAARQDLEVFYDRCGGDLPAPIFDTQIGAALIGYKEQVGYATLVEAITGVKLAKLHTRTDWAARPLAPEQIEYALDDVRYLRDVYLHLSTTLATLERTDWAAEECATQLDPAHYRNDPVDIWRRLKKGHELAPTLQPLLRALAAWREVTAQEQNLPRTWIATDVDLMTLARTQPTSPEMLAQVCPARSPIVRQWSQAILNVIGQAHHLPAESIWPVPVALTVPQQTLAKRVSARIQALTQELNLSPGIIGGRKSIHDFVCTNSGPLTRGWRTNLLGAELRALSAQIVPTDNSIQQK